MGYFANTSESDAYESRHCARCIHYDGGCPVLDAHVLKNYEDCNDPDSVLHILIPRGARGENLRCAMFVYKKE